MQAAGQLLARRRASSYGAGMIADLSHPPRLVPLRAPRRAVPLAWTVVVAFLLQGFMVGPLALLMANQRAAAFTAASFCAVDPSGGGTDGDPGDRRPARSGHDTCLVCQGGVGPLLLLVPVRLPVPEPRPVAARCADEARLPAGDPVAAYWSRAPPDNG